MHRFHGRGRFGGGPEGRFGGMRHGGGGRWRHRVFEQGDLKLVILKLIGEKPRHGYEIIKAIEDAVAGAYAPSPGVVYPTLTLLEELGHATVTAAEGGKKLYAITAQGEAYLDANAEAAAAALARATGAGGDRKSMLRIRRAMENLKMAVRMRASEGELAETAVDAIVAAIDGAAAAVERV